MVEISVTYQGQLHCEAKHGPSGNLVCTDAPKDNMGKGESFSPTDLVATALGTCVLTILGIVAQRKGWDLSGSTARVEKHMSTGADRRIARLPVVITVPAEKAKALSAADRAVLDKAVYTCPVHRSLHPDVDAPLTIVYQDA